MDKKAVSEKSLKYQLPNMIDGHDRLSIPTQEILTKRVMAPYVHLVKMGHNVTLRRTSDNFSYFLQKKSSTLMKNLSTFLTNQKDIPALMHESLVILKSLTKSLGARLYLVDKTRNQLYQYQKNVTYPRCRVNYNIEDSKSIIAHVALTREYILIDDITIDERFTEGITYKENVKPVLCVPIVVNLESVAVMEFYKETNEQPYGKDDLKTVVLVCGWIGLTMQQNREGVVLLKKQEVNDDLLHLVLTYYRKKLTLERLLGEILMYTKQQLDAEKGAFYMIDLSKKKLVADVYEEGLSNVNYVLIKKKLQVKFAKEKSVPGYVAHTRELMNVKDVYNDSRFNKETYKENDATVIKRTELCVPIINNDELLGILTVINKKNGAHFIDEDELMIKVIATYCCMVLNHAKLIREIEVSNLRLKESTDILQFHLKPCEHELRTLDVELKIPKNISKFSWYILPDDMNYMPQYFIYMLKEVVGVENLYMDELKKFVLTVQRSYRDNAYHNFEHAFNVSHCMYAILTRNKEKFALYELEALMLSCLVHDIDHFGVNNNFLIQTNHPYAQLYGDSPFENHHVYVTTQILSVYNIYNNLDETNYPLYLSNVQRHILATDLASHFKSRAKLALILQAGTFNFQDPDHRSLATAISLTVCDLSGQCKPFSVAKKIVDCVYKEFYKQGEMEKSLGLVPVSMMDVNNQRYVPEDQLQFMTIIVLPATKILKEIFPNTEKIYDNCMTLKDTWSRIIETRGYKIWRQCDSFA